MHISFHVFAAIFHSTLSQSVEKLCFVTIQFSTTPINLYPRCSIWFSFGFGFGFGFVFGFGVGWDFSFGFGFGFNFDFALLML